MRNVELSHYQDKPFAVITDTWASHGLQGLWVSNQKSTSQNHFHIIHHIKEITLTLQDKVFTLLL